MPLLFAVVFGAPLYLGDKSYQTIGLAALDSMHQTLVYGLGAGEIIVVAVLVNRFIRYVILEGLVARALGTPVPGLLIQLSGLVVVVTAAAAMFGIVFKQDLTVLWAASGVLGFVFGMALKDMILDVFTGIALNLDRPIRIGDVVQLHRTGDLVIEGKVLEISWRATRLLDDFGNVVIVPNSRLGAATITNFSLPESCSWIIVPVTLDADVPPERAIRILEAAAIEATGVLIGAEAPAPWVGAKGLTTHGVEYSVCLRVPIADRMNARNLTVRHIWKHLHQVGLKPAWPKLEQVEAEDAMSRQDASTPELLATLLGMTPLFRGLPQPALALLAEGAAARALAPGAVITQAGEVAEALYLLLEGLAQAENTRAQGRRTKAIPRLMGPGALVGAQALLLSEGYGETTRCRTAVQLVAFDLPLIGRLLKTFPDLAPLLARRLAEAMGTDAGQFTTSRRRFGSRADLIEDVLADMRRTFPELELP
ncbi:MAG: mechanosensitive ion channel domain-containing protein [Rhodospirillaceae bacterium]